MPKGYWVVDLEVSDPEAYKTYQAFVRPFLAESEGRFLIRGGERQVVEGTMNSRVVVIEFPSFEHASRVYNSAEYQQGMKLRLGASSANLAIVEGFDG